MVAGKGRYFTGLPCRNGHISERRLSDKVCLQCEKDKALRYRQTEKGKVSSLYKNTNSAAKARKKRYRLSKKGIENRRAQRTTDWYKNSRIKFFRSPKGIALSVRTSQAYRARKKRLTIIPFSQDDLNMRFAIFGNRCAYCGNATKLSIDHVIPLGSGGEHSINNIVPACLGCNLNKNINNVESWYKGKLFFDENRWEKIRTHADI